MAAPRDIEVRQALAGLVDTTARSLAGCLARHGYSNREAQRAVQRCIDRGVLRIGKGLRLEDAYGAEA